MIHDQLINMLNELVAFELASAPIRLLESTVFVTQLAVSDESRIKQMAADSQQHAASLTQLVMQLGGSPGLRKGDVHSGDLHFQELRFALPRLIEDEKSLIQKYVVAISRSTSEPKASELLSSIMACHQNYIDQFKQIDNSPSQAADA